MTDPIDDLRVIRPPDSEVWATSAEGRRVMHEALGRGAGPAGRSLPARPRLLLAGGVALALLTGAGYTFIEPNDPTQAGCYHWLDADADMTEADPGLVQRVGFREACVQTWRPLPDRPANMSNLVVCTNRAGGRGVFPAERGLSPTAACVKIGQRAETSP